MKMVTTDIDVECRDGSTSPLQTASPTPVESSGRDVNPEDIKVRPKTPRKSSREEGPVVSRGTGDQTMPQLLVQPASGSIIPVANGKEPSCRVHDREVEAIPQQTGVWCWAASAETIIKFHDADGKAKRNTDQCNIVDTVLDGGTPSAKAGDSPCCKDKYGGRCQQNYLPGPALGAYGYNYRLWKKATLGSMPDDKIRGQLCDNGPFIFIVYYPGGGGHSLIVRDYDDAGDQIRLWVHDHSYVEDKNGNRNPTPFELWSYDAYVNGRWQGEAHEHPFDYVLIQPD
ncbi:MAG: hypothetical protein H8J66_05420 [Nitrospira sp.]|nr:hypothetical protein [Nitrospira sp.]